MTGHCNYITTNFERKIIMFKATAKAKGMKSFIASVIATVGIFGSLMAIPAYADYSYDRIYKDDIDSLTYQGFDLDTHTYCGNDIGANKIHVTAPTRVDYLLELYVRNFWGAYAKYGPSVTCDTVNLDGWCWWEGVSPDAGSNSARLRIWRPNGGSTPLGGFVESQGRTWR